MQNLCFGPFMLTKSVLGLGVVESEEQSALQLLTKMQNKIIHKAYRVVLQRPRDTRTH